MTIELLDRVRGSLLGLAIGDALGQPTEFLSMEQIRAKFGPRGISDFEGGNRHPPGLFTDDTQMSIAVARALARDGFSSLDALMVTMGQEFVAWSKHPTNNRAPGGTCMAGCHNLHLGRPWREAGVKNSKGCGAAMRAAPVGWFFFDDDAALVTVAAAQSVLTHSHPTGVASSVAAAAPVAWVMKGNGLDGIIDYTRRMVMRIDADLLVGLGCDRELVETVGLREQLAALDRLEAALDQETDDVCALLGGAWIGEEAVSTSMWCAIKAGERFDASVLRGANSSGDSDSVACMAGAITGALVGVGGLPATWVERVERSADLDGLARALWEVKRSRKNAGTLPGRLDFFDAEASLADSVD